MIISYLIFNRMNKNILLCFAILLYFFRSNLIFAQISSETKQIILQHNRENTSGNSEEALKILDKAIAKNQKQPEDLAYLYSYKSSFYISKDS